MKSQSLSMERFQKPTTKATHQGVEVVEHFAKYFDIPPSGKSLPFDFSFHLGKVKKCGINMYHAERIINIMLGRESWLKREKGETLHRGKWITNRYKEIAEIGPDKFISKNS